MILPAGVYAILDVGPTLPPGRAIDVAGAFLRGGASAIQLRAKALPANELLSLARALRALVRHAPFVVNDRADVAALVSADAVHLGQSDLPLEAVRAWLPRSIGIGVSCHDLGQLEDAIRGGADYAGYGPVYPTRTKANPDPVVGLDGLRAATGRSIPIVAIGGITIARLPEVRRAGATAAAMISELVSEPDVEGRVRAAQAAFR